MIVVKSKYHERKYCYGGSGLFNTILNKVINKTASSTIARKVVNAATKDGLKKVINKAASSTIAHKVADAAVNGATSATQKAVENKVTDLLKRKAPTTTAAAAAAGGKTNKKLKVDISHLINNSSGSGIVLDLH